MRGEPKLTPLEVYEPKPTVSQKVQWQYGSHAGEVSELRVVAYGNTLDIHHHDKVIGISLDRAKLLHEAIGNVLEAAAGLRKTDKRETLQND